jgi:hypothetical protein
VEQLSGYSRQLEAKVFELEARVAQQAAAAAAAAAAAERRLAAAQQEAADGHRAVAALQLEVSGQEVELGLLREELQGSERRLQDVRMGAAYLPARPPARLPWQPAGLQPAAGGRWQARLARCCSMGAVHGARVGT